MALSIFDLVPLNYSLQCAIRIQFSFCCDAGWLRPFSLASRPNFKMSFRPPARYTVTPSYGRHSSGRRLRSLWCLSCSAVYLLGESISVVALTGRCAYPLGFRLTLGLMGLDELHLRVLATSSEDPIEQRNATTGVLCFHIPPYPRIHDHQVLRLLQRGRHWVLVVRLPWKGCSQAHLIPRSSCWPMWSLTRACLYILIAPSVAFLLHECLLIV